MSRLLHDQRFVAHQAEARRVRVAQVGAREQLARVEAAVRIDALLVRAEFADFVVGQEFQLRDADAVLAGNHAVERARELHDARDRVMRVLQHLVVVGVDGDVRVNVAVARVHVERDEHAAAQHLLVDVLRFVEDRLELAAVENLAQFRADFLLPRNAHRAVLRDVEHGRARLAHRRDPRIFPPALRSRARPCSAAPRATADRACRRRTSSAPSRA